MAIQRKGFVKRWRENAGIRLLLKSEVDKQIIERAKNGALGESTAQTAKRARVLEKAIKRNERRERLARVVSGRDNFQLLRDFELGKIRFKEKAAVAAKTRTATEKAVAKYHEERLKRTLASEPGRKDKIKFYSKGFAKHAARAAVNEGRIRRAGPEPAGLGAARTGFADERAVARTASEAEANERRLLERNLAEREERLQALERERAAREKELEDSARFGSAFRELSARKPENIISAQREVIEARQRLERLEADVRERTGKRQGPVFVDLTGREAGELNAARRVLERKRPSAKASRPGFLAGIFGLFRRREA